MATPNITVPFRLSTEVQPGKPRDPFLQQQTSQIEAAINQALGRQSLRTVVLDTVCTVADWWILADATNGDIAVTLPLASVGLRAIGVKKIDSTGNIVTVRTTGTNLLDGAGYSTITDQYQTITCVPNGVSGWYIFGCCSGLTASTYSYDFSIDANSMYIPMVF